MKLQRGFTLVELLIYTGVFTVVAGLMTGVMYNSSKVKNKEVASTEVSQQLNFVLDTVQQLVSEASLVDLAYEDTEGTQCTSGSDFCTLKLRMKNPSLDPTLFWADASGVYMKQGGNATTTLTNEKVVVDYLRFTKYEFAGGHASADIDLSLTYNTANTQMRVTRNISSAFGRASAATFDSSLLPNTGSSFDVGQNDTRWRDGYFSRNVIVGGNLAIAEGSAPASATGYGKLYVNTTNKGLYFLNSANTSSVVSLNMDTKCLWMSNPTAVDDLKSIWTTNGFSATLTKVWCESDQTVNADLQVDDGTPEDVDGTDLVCDATPAEDEALAGDATMADGDRLDLAITSVSGSPTWLSICWTVTYDF